MRTAGVFFLLAWALVIAGRAAPEPELPLHADAVPAQRLPQTVSPLSWPAIGLQSLPRLGEFWDEWDGMPRRHRTFVLPGLTLLAPWSVMDYWIELPAAERGRHGYTTQHRWNSDLRFSLTWVRSEVFLSTLDEASWLAYLAELAKVRGRLLLANDDSDQNPQMLTLLGQRTRFLAYVDPATTDVPARLTWQAVLQHRGYTIIYTLSGEYGNLVVMPELFNSMVMGLEDAAAL
jgi:hypothetical protein